MMDEFAVALAPPSSWEIHRTKTILSAFSTAFAGLSRSFTNSRENEASAGTIMFEARLFLSGWLHSCHPLAALSPLSLLS
jgi:hypothetical protein